MSKLTNRQSQCLTAMMNLYAMLGRMPKRFEVASVMGVHPTRVSRLWSKLERLGYLGLNPVEILRDESGSRIAIEVNVTIRKVVA